MAKVIVLTFTNMPRGLLDSFRQGFVDALVREGNEVLLIKTNDFLRNYNESNKLAADIDEASLLDYLGQFAPDLIVSMNHSGLFPGLSRKLSCPVLVWLLDGPAYLVEPNEVIMQRERYHMLVPVRAFREDLQHSFGFAKKRIHYVPFASDFCEAKLTKEHKISFIGTFFTDWRFRKIVSDCSTEPSLLEKIRTLIASYHSDLDKPFITRLKEMEIDSSLFPGDFDEGYILNTLAINKRIQVLDAVQDLGLRLLGSSNWLDVMPFSLNLALSYEPTEIVRKQDLEKVYNSSLINLNISHTQARGGLPWRVFDIMACSGAIVSDYQEDIDLLLGKEAMVPVYNSPQEAREICARLLSDESLRMEQVQRNNSCISQKHRMVDRIREIAMISETRLQTDQGGSMKLLNSAEFKVVNSILYFSNKTSNTATIELVPKSNFPVQLFYSSSLTFTQTDSQLIELPIEPSGKIECSFYVEAGNKYLRLDVGEYYSEHTEFVLTIAPAGTGEYLEQAILIEPISRSTAHNQFSGGSGSFACGFDAYTIFKNPFPKVATTVTFRSKLSISLDLVSF